MPLLVIPNVFVDGTIADAIPVNENFLAVQGIVNGLDNTNVGPLGIYASQILPIDKATATFGSDQGYWFNTHSATTVALSIAQATGQTADLFEVQDTKATPHTLMAIGPGGGLLVHPTDPAVTQVLLTQSASQTAPAFELLDGTLPVILMGPDGQITITPLAGATVPLIINQASAGQNAPLMQFWNSAHTQVVQAVLHHGGLHITPDLVDTIQMVLVASVGQTADMLDINDNANNKLIWVDHLGVLHTSTQPQFGSVGVGIAANFTSIFSVMDETFQVLALVNSAHHDNVGWAADRHQAQIYEITQDPAQSFVWYSDTGLTLGANFDPTPVMTLAPEGVLRLPLGGGYLGLGFATLACNVQGIALPNPHLDMVVGAHYLDPNWVADAAVSEAFEVLHATAPTAPSFAWYSDFNLTVGAHFTRTQIAALSQDGIFTSKNAVQPGNGTSALGVGARLYSGQGSPTGIADAQIGDFYFRFDNGTATTNRIYVKTGASAWTTLI